MTQGGCLSQRSPGSPCTNSISPDTANLEDKYMCLCEAQGGLFSRVRAAQRQHIWGSI